ncbi:MAG TPA: hypothetical protein VJ258_01420 [Candidatus Limnocylindrales bacterium]|nr:hypothetical protein [Candidatus Limnocylindrales bacterium]
MAGKMVRCHRCHEVFDADAGPCTKCGAPYRPPVAPPQAPDVPYVEQYAGTPFVPSPETAPVAPLSRRNVPVLLIGGVSLIGLAIVIAIVAVSGGLAAGPTAPPVYVRPLTEPPSPPPTLPASVALTLQQLNDRNLSADVVVQSVADVNDPSLGKHERHAVSFDGQIAGGNEAGIVIEEGITREYRIVGGIVFVKVSPTARWSTAASIAGYLVIDPTFGLSKPAMLQLVGEETQDGQLVNHFHTTSSWAPDVARIAMIDTSGFLFKPDVVVLNLWTSHDGSPMKAVFSATNTATNGTKLLDIETTYTFTNVGVPLKIEVPGPSPSGSLRASPSK